MEEFKDIKGYEGIYQCSNFGNILSLNYHNTGKPKLLKLSISKYGYYKVILCKHNITKSYLVHRIVAETFIPNDNQLPIINHKDENTLNNNVNNLEWCDYKYNVNYGNRNYKVKIGNIKTKREKYSKAVGCYKDNNLIKKYNTMIDVEKDGFIATLVCKVCRGKRKSHKGYIWKYI